MKITDFIGETTEYDKKEMLEERKPRSWLKSVSAFANGIGGALIFGVSNDETLVGLTNVRAVSERISENIKMKITPYYYVADGNRVAYVRVGNKAFLLMQQR